MSSTKDIERYLANRQKEIDGAAMYLALAESEKQPPMAEVYRKLAASEQKHATAWEKKLADLGARIPPRRISWRTTIMIWLARRFGPQFVLPTLTANERADSQAETEAEEFSTDEKSHARLLAMASQSTSGIPGGTVAQLEGRHRASGGNALRAAGLG